MIDIIVVLVFAFIIELITLFGRFFFKLSSKEIYIRLIKKLDLKFFIHFHHFLFGLITSLISFHYNFPLLFNIGLGMILSDIFHHFIILWAIVGNPEFHIVYKNPKHFQKEQKIENKKIKKFINHIIHVFE